MGIKVIRKNNNNAHLGDAADALISLASVDIIPDGGDLPSTTEPLKVSSTGAIKQEIDISYDSKGNPKFLSANLGMQYDNRVTWLRVNVDELLWNRYQEIVDKEDEFTQKYEHYIFKWHFKNLTDGEAHTWSFDPGERWEVPREITQNAGKYSVTLTIEEDMTNNVVEGPNRQWNGNVPEWDPNKTVEENATANEQEIFVCAPWTAIIDSSIIYNPDLDIQVYVLNTDQKRALTKPSIEGTLTDNGTLTFSTNKLGIQFDRYISYIKLNPRNVTQHLKDMTLIAAFKNSETSVLQYSLFQPMKSADEYDDYTDSYPLVAWVPPRVTEIAGKWQVCILAVAGNVSESEAKLEEYYFYISKAQKMIVEKSKISSYDIIKEPHYLNIPSEKTEYFYTSEDDEFYTTLGKILKTRTKPVVED